MMNVSNEEREAIRVALASGRDFGYGNIISHLKTAWARTLMETYGFDEAGARKTAGGEDGFGYPFEMQDDILTRGEWDETGARYRPRAKVGAK